MTTWEKVVDVKALGNNAICMTTEEGHKLELGNVEEETWIFLHVRHCANCRKNASKDKRLNIWNFLQSINPPFEILSIRMQRAGDVLFKAVVEFEGKSPTTRYARKTIDMIPSMALALNNTLAQPSTNIYIKREDWEQQEKIRKQMEEQDERFMRIVRGKMQERQEAGTQTKKPTQASAAAVYIS